MGIWDLCAPEAIIRAMGGVCTDWNRKHINYSVEALPTRRIPAFIIGKNVNTYMRVAQRLCKL